MTKLRTHYDNLQVVETASIEVIRGAYRHLAQKWHPDKNQGNQETAERNSKIINEAYAVLSDPQRRREHDEWIAAQRAADAGSATFDAASSNPKAGTKERTRAANGFSEHAHSATQTPLRQRGEPRYSQAPASAPKRLGVLARLGITVVFLFSLTLCLLGLHDLVFREFRWIRLVGFVIWGPLCAYAYIALFRPRFVSEETYQQAIKQLRVGSFLGAIVAFGVVLVLGFLLYILFTEGW